MNENSKKIKKFAVWTIAIFATIFAVVMTVLWLPLYNAGATAMSAIGQAFSAGWMIFLVVAILCLMAYFGYKLIISRKS